MDNTNVAYDFSAMSDLDLVKMRIEVLRSGTLVHNDKEFIRAIDEELKRREQMRTQA